MALKRRIVLRELLQRAIKPQQNRLTAAELFDARAKRGPVVHGDRKMPPQIEQRDLANLAPVALGTHQAVREVRLARRLVVGTYPPDVHAARA